MIVVASLLAGVLSALAFVAGPFADGSESQITGALLLGFALGWALLGLLSARFTDRPQLWAAAPAAAMGLTGAALIVLAPGARALSSLGWVWPALLLALVVWTAMQARRRPVSRVQSWLLFPVFAALALAAIGGAYETLRSAAASTGAPTGSRLIDVGGHRLSIRCTGSGGPTVVLEPGLGEPSSAMSRWIAPDVAHTTTVCVYDRAGHGHSDTVQRADGARDLHVLLARAHAPGPYVVAGHSLGGLYALDYARRYPAQVAGVVLLDSMHPHQANAFAGMDPMLAVVPTLARTGLANLVFDRRDGDPAAQARQLVRDIADMPAELNRAAKLTSLGDRPLAVVSAGTGYMAGWPAHQAELAKLSQDSIHRTIAGATHASLVNDRVDAAQSSRAIRDVVKAVQRAGG
jgi:pimeloyl-ACP methyl ester carboxylesterase